MVKRQFFATVAVISLLYQQNSIGSRSNWLSNPDTSIMLDRLSDWGRSIGRAPEGPKMRSVRQKIEVSSYCYPRLSSLSTNTPYWFNWIHKIMIYFKIFWSDFGSRVNPVLSINGQIVAKWRSHKELVRSWIGSSFDSLSIAQGF